jgi:hypothetical protein
MNRFLICKDLYVKLNLASVTTSCDVKHATVLPQSMWSAMLKHADTSHDHGEVYWNKSIRNAQSATNCTTLTSHESGTMQISIAISTLPKQKPFTTHIVARNQDRLRIIANNASKNSVRSRWVAGAAATCRYLGEPTCCWQGAVLLTSRYTTGSRKTAGRTNQGRKKKILPTKKIYENNWNHNIKTIENHSKPAMVVLAVLALCQPWNPAPPAQQDPSRRSSQAHQECQNQWPQPVCGDWEDSKKQRKNYI